MKAAIYLRVSTEEQRERQSIATQRTFAQTYCASHNISPFSWYEDDGVSGMLPLHERLHGNRLLADAQAGAIDTIFVYRLDRLGREPRLILNVVSDLESLGLQIISMTEPFDTSTPSGKFMLTILSAVAGLERDTIIQRSVEGSNRLAREGTWLGGIAPYGYRVIGKDRTSRLVVSEHIIAGLHISEAEVVRLIYQMTVEEKKSCVTIADYLNSLGIPPAYARDQRKLLRGKSKVTTSGIWRSGRIRTMLINPTYKGLHRYGQHTKRDRAVIERAVPAIVSVELWERAQQVLHEHFLFHRRNARRSYLLRGLIKCAHCGLTYVGTAWPSYHSEPEVYYVCNGRHQAHHIFGSKDKKCLAKAVQGARLETALWQDIEHFLRNPGTVLDLLVEQMRTKGDQSAQFRAQLAHFQQTLQAKNREKDAVITLFRRGRIDERDLDAQLDQIAREEGELHEQIRRLQTLLQDAQSNETVLRSAEALLQKLSSRLDEPLTWELQRQLIEALIERIVVETLVNTQGKQESSITVTYRFGVSLAL